MRPKIDEFLAACHERLRRSPQAFGFLTEERGLKVDTIKAEGIGFCTSRLAEKFCKDCDVPTDSRPFVFRMLSGRTVFPIRDDFGKVVSFATRSSTGDHQGVKWWNFPFSKKSYLYGLHDAKRAAFEQNKLYLVEGYLDRLILAQEGLRNTCGLMGVGLSLRGAGLALRYCDRICISLDTDPTKNGREGAGQMGLSRIVREFLLSGVFERMTAIVLDVGVDPDEFVLQQGLPAFLARECGVELD